MTETISIYCPGNEFLLPYIKEELKGVKITEVIEAAPAIMISSCDIYGEGTKEMCDESSPTEAQSQWQTLENGFTAQCSRTGAPHVILRCADIIGTGMNGFARSLANDIWRGTFLHFPGNEARRSVVHASDIGRIVHTIASEGMPASGTRIFNVSDGTDPTIHDIAEALAFRMANKRISTLSTRPQQIIARLLYGKKKMAAYTTTRTFSSARLAQELNFRATDTCRYMRTHIYDENSL